MYLQASSRCSAADAVRQLQRALCQVNNSGASTEFGRTEDFEPEAGRRLCRATRAAVEARFDPNRPRVSSRLSPVFDHADPAGSSICDRSCGSRPAVRRSCPVLLLHRICSGRPTYADTSSRIPFSKAILFGLLSSHFRYFPIIDTMMPPTTPIRPKTKEDRANSVTLCGQIRKPLSWLMSVAHDMSGLGSARSVR